MEQNLKEKLPFIFSKSLAASANTGSLPLETLTREKHVDALCAHYIWKNGSQSVFLCPKALEKGAIFSTKEEALKTNPGLEPKLQDLENLPLQRSVVDTDGAAACFVAVYDYIISVRVDLVQFSALEIMDVLFFRRCKRMMHRLIASFLLRPFEHREVGHPQKLVVVGIQESELSCDVAP